jgi:hypothetical protein
MNITKITIGRLYNLGSYEHIRYELTCEIPPGESPATAIVGMEKIICGLNPKMSGDCVSEFDEKRKRLEIEDMNALDDEAFKDRYVWNENLSRSEYMKNMLGSLNDGVVKRKKWEARAAKARKLLEDLGGAANWRDAKMEWDIDDQ